ncbi:MAG: LptF/LptG family permease [Lentisphaeria bacterium]|jgi:lipopolysaccharide export system permease protein|nr:LptF/LptG family permease [Lentisphaeria bacterium]
MFILNWYITKNFLATFAMSIVVLTFAMTGTNLMRMIEYISQGVPPMTAGKFLLLALPMALAFSIPWASLVSIMLVFGRLSADNEITAMRACGVSILQIISPIIVSSFLLTCLCLWLQLEVGPPALGEARDVVKSAAASSPMSFFTPGIPVQLGNLTFFIDGKETVNGEDQIYGVQIYVPDRNGVTKQDILASRGTLKADPASQTLTVTLYNAIIESVEGTGKDRRTELAYSESFDLPVTFGEHYNQKDVFIKDKYLGYRNLFARLAIYMKRGKDAAGVDATAINVEINQRIALALAPIAFMMLGMPLAIRTSRRETSIGLLLSVALGGLYYGGVLISDALRYNPQFYPQYVVWIPPLLFQLFGVVYLTKIARK